VALSSAQQRLHRSSRLIGLGVIAVILTSSLAACGGSSAATSADSGPTTPATLTSKQVVLLTHDSFAVSKAVLADFTRRTGVQVKVIQSGDVGELVNKAILAKGKPQADVLYGVDNTFLGRAEAAGILAPHRATGLGTVDPSLLVPSGLATPIDRGDVCLNVDSGYFASRGIEAPTSFDDLVDPRYRNLTVVQNPSTSSPGLAFLLATIDAKGDGWQAYWQQLKANGVKVVDGWESAYYGQFSGGSGKGTRPIVVSYGTSPVAEVVYADPRPKVAPTKALLNTCFEQIEYAAVLEGAKHPDTAGAFVDFMLGKRFQADVPLQMFVYPVNRTVSLPPEFTQFAPYPKAPATMTADRIETNRDTWLRQWRSVMES
jgi:thiamine transport system substrate-binding protein